MGFFVQVTLSGQATGPAVCAISLSPGREITPPQGEIKHSCTCILHEGTGGFRAESNMALASQNHQTGPGIPLEHFLLVPIEARAAGLQNNWERLPLGLPRNSVGERLGAFLSSFTVELHSSSEQQPVFRDFCSFSVSGNSYNWS